MARSRKQETTDKPGRRGNGDGSITWRDDRQKYQVSRSLDGKRRYAYVDTPQEARALLRQWDRELEQGVKFDRPNYTVQTFLEYWLELKKPSLKPSSYASYYLHVQRISAVLGKVKLDKLTSNRVQEAINVLLEELQVTTVKTLRTLLATGMKDAIIWGLIPKNPVDGVKIPSKRDNSSLKVLTLEQAVALMTEAHAQDIQMWALISLALATGARIGELAGLRWSDIDFVQKKLCIDKCVVPVYLDGRTEYVEGSPKTVHSIRELVLPNFALEALESHRIAQREKRLKVGAKWIDKELVFTNESGSYVNRQTIANRFRRVLRATASIPDDLKDLHFHCLRHTAASILLAQGVPVTTVQERLGHASPDITLRVYAHALPGGQEVAMEGLNSLIQRLQ